MDGSHNALCNYHRWLLVSTLVLEREVLKTRPPGRRWAGEVVAGQERGSLGQERRPLGHEGAVVQGRALQGRRKGRWAAIGQEA